MSVGDIRVCLKKPLTSTIPLPPGWKGPLTDVAKKIFSVERLWYPGDFETVAGLVLRSKITSPVGVPSEAMGGHMTQKLIFDVLQKLSAAGVVHLCCNQNVVEATLTQLGIRPDALFHEIDSRVLVLKGEEKRFDIQAATNELTNKMIPFNTLRLGNLPYLFCYASDAQRICFYVIEKDDEKKATPVTEMLDLGTVDGQLSVLLTVVNIYRVICSLKSNDFIGPAVALPFGCPLKWSSVSVVMPQMTHIAKYVHNSAQHVNIEFLRGQLYPYLRDAKSANRKRPWHVTWPESPSAGKPNPRMTSGEVIFGDGDTRQTWLAVALLPLGDPRVAPRSVEELFKYAADILDGLAVLHALNVAHRDVRAPNVVYDTDASCWVLIDVDFAAQFGVPIDWEGESIDPVAINTGCSAQTDLYSLGKLILQFVHATPAEHVLKHFCGILCRDHGESFASALEALSWLQDQTPASIHMWFSDGSFTPPY